MRPEKKSMRANKPMQRNMKLLKDTRIINLLYPIQSATVVSIYINFISDFFQIPSSNYSNMDHLIHLLIQNK